MSLENWAEGLLDKSFFARAVRKSTAKSVVLGWLDAIQNPNGVLSEITGAEGQAPASAPPERALPASPPGPGQPVSLPRPRLLPVPGDDAADEPDRPGVPPRKVRKQRRQSPTNGQQPAPPANGQADDPPSGPTPGDASL